MAQLLTYPDTTLLQISGLVRDFKDPQLPGLIEELKKTAHEHNLKGLAAIQIGVPLRIIVMKRGDGSWLEMINPVIYAKEGEYFPSPESDETIPGATLTVRRYPVVKIMYEDRQGQTHYYTSADKAEAIWLQRKIDMIFGGYLFDKLDKKAQKEFFKRYGSYEPTCPTSFVKDKILAALRLWLVFHFLGLITTLFAQWPRWLIEYNLPLWALEVGWILVYAFYARYETKKYRNCTSCQNANILGTSGLYFASATLLLLFSWILGKI
ncbi:MAG: hypothetical protein C6I00_06465 [Nitratiruptor sp.]|nr:hypothetical protein [Nitratiruptor sp.]NPA83087.1 peptide deformylase [Campylobacterota bacterium]